MSVPRLRLSITTIGLGTSSVMGLERRWPAAWRAALSGKLLEILVWGLSVGRQKVGAMGIGRVRGFFGMLAFFVASDGGVRTFRGR
jgi:hypothetical protein